jgi:hypothetical protein
MIRSACGHCGTEERRTDIYICLRREKKIGSPALNAQSEGRGLNQKEEKNPSQEFTRLAGLR